MSAIADGKDVNMKKSMFALSLGMLGAFAIVKVVRLERKRTAQQKIYADKHLNILKNMNQWLILKQEKKTIKPYFEKNGYKKVAIYGMSYLGERLLDDLNALGIEVSYAIDKNASNLYSEIDIYAPDDILPEVDAVIVTATYYYDEIVDTLSKKFNCSIISLEDILYDV